MKKIFLKQLFYTLVIAFSLTGCDKDTDLTESPENVNNSSKKLVSNEIDNKLAEYIREYNGELVYANFIGRIINENNAPIVGATVTLGGQDMETDQNGVVTFTNVQVYEHFAHARAFANGYLEGSRVMVPNLDAGNQNNFTIKLFRFNEVASINSDQGGEINFETEIGEGLLQFNPGFTDQSGNQYHGSVAVSINYLNPLNPDTANTMPGDLYGITQNMEQVALGSYGMIQVELRGTAGEKLQIIDPANLRMPIHPDHIATAANQVPMWSFNENAGVWYEETIAYKDGDHYIAEVPHFSFWNCDAPFPVVNFSATVIDAITLNPLGGLLVEIQYSGFTRFATTNTSGLVSGKIPAGQIMTITIFDSCGNVLYSNASFGPFIGTTNIVIPVTTSPLQTFNLSGTVNDCVPAPVTNGYLALTNNLTGLQIATIQVTAGTYSYTGIGCILPANITITAVDYSTAQGSTITTTVNSGANTQNIVICGGLASEYIRYSINAGPWQYDLLNPSGGIGNTGVFLKASNSTGATYIYSNTITLGFGYPFGVGPNNMFIEALGDINGLNPNATMALANPLTFDLIAITPGPLGIGTYISVDFTGNYVDYNGITKTIQGEARIYRDF